MQRSAYKVQMCRSNCSVYDIVAISNSSGPTNYLGVTGPPTAATAAIDQTPMAHVRGKEPRRPRSSWVRNAWASGRERAHVGPSGGRRTVTSWATVALAASRRHREGSASGRRRTAVLCLHGHPRTRRRAAPVWAQPSAYNEQKASAHTTYPGQRRQMRTTQRIAWVPADRPTGDIHPARPKRGQGVP